MKNTIAMGIALFSLRAFAQSYIVLENGVTLTTSKEGKVLDLNNFTAPGKISDKGGVFYVEDGALTTVADNGFLFRKDMKVKGLKGKGLNYIINDSGEIMTMDANGFVYKYTTDASLLKKVNKFGGNYFAIEDAAKKETTLFTVSKSGLYSKITLAKVKTQGITQLGGNYFGTKDGTLYTVSKDGFVFVKSEKARNAKLGGNFLVTEKDVLMTVTQEGYLLKAVTPESFKTEEIKVYGSNFMINSAGVVYVMDVTGTLIENTVQHDVLSAKHYSSLK